MRYLVSVIGLLFINLFGIGKSHAGVYESASKIIKQDNFSVGDKADRCGGCGGTN